ncbi:uncharacterized protein EI97DRAFT_173113 [Westerdykella ornata]|uniref:Uncharacterized protein n=1 Tax=Westerdykella ornata TaxID=318751 RepID=A0A6A6JWA0_WESOR|nr:uncharacterized protein EI97DRAFT_173113 [Westerdykella ornata]KAF2279339.1 hypothetical protein EI97DRAFT_173113 [Westerdykella ornata]
MNFNPYGAANILDGSHHGKKKVQIRMRVGSGRSMLQALERSEAFKEKEDSYQAGVQDSRSHAPTFRRRCSLARVLWPLYPLLDYILSTVHLTPLQLLCLERFSGLGCCAAFHHHHPPGALSIATKLANHPMKAGQAGWTMIETHRTKSMPWLPSWGKGLKKTVACR